jgi:molecular chaperone HscB
MSPAKDDFELFGLPRRFALDRGELDSRRRALQAEVHPDRFAAPMRHRGAPRCNRRCASTRRMRGSAIRSSAPRTFASSPARRFAPRTTPRCRSTSCASRWRGASRSTTPARARRSTPSRASSRASGRFAYDRLAGALDERRDFGAAAEQVRALMFIERFAADVEDRLVALEG